MALHDVAIGKIKVVENHRVNINDVHLAELMQSIRQHGVMQPIGVASNGNGAFVLRFGHRRLLACQKLGWKTIPAIVSAKMDDQKLLIENLTENVQREDPSFAEIGRIINKLETKNLTLSQIAARLGLPIAKIRTIVEVYTALPEKFRKNVMFMERGGGRKSRKGSIPAQVAVKIVKMKKDHGLSDKSIDHLFTQSVEGGLSESALDNVSSLMKGGISAEEALSNATKYGVYTIDVVARHSDISLLMEKYRLVSRTHLFKKAIYGEIPPIPKPDFVFTGLHMDEKDVVHRDNKELLRIRVKLQEMAKMNLLTEAQSAAVDGLRRVHIKDWSDEQAKQIRGIYKEVYKK